MSVWCDDYGDCYDDGNDGVIAAEPPAEDWRDGLVDNGDGSYSDPETFQIFDDSGNVIGIENDDGTWTGLNGMVYNADGSAAFDPTFEYDPVSGLYRDNLTGLYYYLDAEGNAQPFQEGQNADPQDFTQPKGFLESIGDALGKLFGGSGAQGGGGSMSTGQQQGAQQRAQQAQQQLQQAQQQGASAAQLAQLRQQLALAQAAASGSDSTKLILIAAAAVGVTYAIASRRGGQTPS